MVMTLPAHPGTPAPSNLIAALALRAVMLFAAVHRGVAFGTRTPAAGCASYDGQECAACTNHQNVDGGGESCLYRPGTHECLDAAASSSAALLDKYGRKINLLAHGHCDNLCAENTCGEHSHCVYNAATKNVSCPCDQGYLAIENSECVKITTGGEVSSDCKDQPPAGMPAQYCTMMKGMGSCANVGQHENMLTQCPVSCGFCDARKKITCTDIAQIRVSCRRRFLDKALPSVCSAECAPVYLKWWHNCSHDDSIQKLDGSTHELTNFAQTCTKKDATLPPPPPPPHTPALVASGPCSAFDGKTCERCTDHQDGSGNVQVCNYRPGTKQCIGANNHPLDQLGRTAYLIARGTCTDKCSEFSCPAHSTCHWDASTKKAHCPCDAGYLAVDKTQCVRVTDGGAINPECVDNPPADVADRSTYCGLEKQVGACTAKTLVDEMMSQCTKTCGFCKALPKLSCMNVARVNIACPSFKLGEIMPSNCTAGCASVYLAWWQRCGKDAQVVAFDQAKGQLAAMATKCKAVPAPKTLAGDVTSTVYSVSGALDASRNGVYTQTASKCNGKPVWQSVDGRLVLFQPTGALYWVIGVSSHGLDPTSDNYCKDNGGKDYWSFSASGSPHGGYIKSADTCPQNPGGASCNKKWQEWDWADSADLGEPGQDQWEGAPNIVVASSGWHLAPPGAPTCDYGTVASQAQCEAAVAALAQAAGKTPARALAVGSGCIDGSGWDMVPLGCSAQSGGDWTAHFKTSAGSGVGCTPTTVYQLICSEHYEYEALGANKQCVAANGHGYKHYVFSEGPSKSLRACKAKCSTTTLCWGIHYLPSFPNCHILVDDSTSLSEFGSNVHGASNIGRFRNKDPGVGPITHTIPTDKWDCYKKNRGGHGVTAAPTSATAAASTTADSSSYAVGAAGTNTCPGGSTRITTSVACTAASVAQGRGDLSGPADSESSYPKGCYLYGSASSYFNTHSTGGTASTSRPLCIKTTNGVLGSSN